MSEWRMLLTDVVLIAGSLAMTLAIVGVMRLRDHYAKIHSAGKAVVIGVLAVVLSCVLVSPFELIVRAVLVGTFLLITAPVGAHALAQLEARLGAGGGDEDTLEP